MSIFFRICFLINHFINKYKKDEENSNNNDSSNHRWINLN